MSHPRRAVRLRRTSIASGVRPATEHADERNLSPHAVVYKNIMSAYADIILQKIRIVRTALVGPPSAVMFGGHYHHGLLKRLGRAEVDCLGTRLHDRHVTPAGRSGRRLFTPPRWRETLAERLDMPPGSAWPAIDALTGDCRASEPPKGRARPPR